MIIIFAHIKFSRIYSPARKYVLRENVYVTVFRIYAMCIHPIGNFPIYVLHLHELRTASCELLTM